MNRYPPPPTPICLPEICFVLMSGHLSHVHCQVLRNGLIGNWKSGKSHMTITRLYGAWPCNLRMSDVDNSGRHAYKCSAILVSYMPMLHTERLRKCLVCAALFCTVAAARARQGTGATQSPASAGVATAPISDTALFEVAPGIPLPQRGIVWVLDTTEGNPELVRLSLSNASFNRHIGENIARSQFF